MDTSGIIECVNPAFKNFFGYEDADVEGRHFSILFTEEDRAAGKPASEVKRVIESGQADDKNFLVHKDQTISWVSGESVLVTHQSGTKSLLKVIQDIRVQKEYENFLTRATDFNEIILKAIDDFVVVLDPSLKLVNSNPAFSRLFAESTPASVSDFISYIRPFDHQESLLTLIKQAGDSDVPFSREVVRLDTNSGERIFELSCQRVRTRDMDGLLLLIGHDITLQQKADLEREDLMGFVAHELRNPLASILMSNDLMAFMIAEDKTDQLKMLLEKNKRNIERLNKMVTELYDATRIGGGNFLLNKAPFDFDDMLTEAVETFRVLQPAHQFSLTDRVNTTFNGDRYRIQQVVSNYLSNAVKYSDGAPDIRIGVLKHDNSIVVSVRDFGIGIPEEQMSHIFERFFRTEKARYKEGIGLGLYLCRRIIQAHGGRVWAESEDGKGSTFYFSLPLQ